MEYIDGFAKWDFLQYMYQEFPSVYNNVHSRELLENTVDYCIENDGDSQSRLIDVLKELIPEVTHNEITRFFDNKIQDKNQKNQTMLLKELCDKAETFLSNAPDYDEMSDVEIELYETVANLIEYQNVEIVKDEKERELYENEERKVVQAENLPEGWKWVHYDDASGHLKSPQGKNYFSYDWNTGEYQTTEDKNYDFFLNENYDTGGYSIGSFKEFKTFAENWIKNNILKSEQIKENTTLSEPIKEPEKGSQKDKQSDSPSKKIFGVEISNGDKEINGIVEAKPNSCERHNAIKEKDFANIKDFDR